MNEGLSKQGYMESQTTSVEHKECHTGADKVHCIITEYAMSDVSFMEFFSKCRIKLDSVTG